MRESRTYGSVRGACDETHVPTATTPRWSDVERVLASFAPRATSASAFAQGRAMIVRSVPWWAILNGRT